MKRCIVAALLGLPALPAQAVDFDAGPVSGRLDTRISFGAAVRVEGRDERLVAKLAVPGQHDLCAADDCQSSTGDPAPNQRLVDARGAFSGVNEDNGNLNYDRGDPTAAIFQIRPKLDLAWDDWQFSASGLFFHDLVNADFEETHADTRFQPRHTARSGDVAALYASGMRLGNLYLARPFELGGHELLLKVGNQVLNWGEANLVQFNTLSEFNPLDAPVLGMPGAEPSQLQVATPLAVADFALSDTLSAEAVYQLAWRGAKLPASGSFLSTNDVAGRGNYAILGLGNYSEDPDREYSPAGLTGLISSSTRTIYIPGEHYAEPRDGGQYGFRLNYLADWLNNGTEIALHYLRYHSRYPLVSGIAADASCTRDAALPGFVGAFIACQGFKGSINPLGREPLPVDTATLFLDYPENIELYGISFNTNVGDWAVSGEYAYRPNQPLQILQSDVLFATLGPAFPAQDIPVGVQTLTDPLLALVPGALAQPLQNLTQSLIGQLPSSTLFTLPGEDNAVPDYLSRYRHQTIGAGDYVRGYERLGVSQLTLTGIGTFARNPFGAAQMVWVIEAAMDKVHGMPPRGELYFEGAGDRTHPSAGADGTGTPDGQPDTRHVNPTQMTKGFADSFSYGWRTALRLSYDDLPGGIRVNPTLIFFQDLHGTSPAPIVNFIEGRKVFIGNVSVDFESDWSVGLSYQVFTGAGTRNRLRDRDNVSAYVAYVF